MLKKIYREFQQILFGYGVPFVPTSDQKLDIILQNMDIQTGEVFIDLGCGDGKVIDQVKKKFPDALCRGYEISPYPYKLACERRAKSQRDYELHKSNMFQASFVDVDHIYIYMLPYMIPKLIQKIESECRPATKIYIQTHQVKTWKASKRVPLSEKNSLYIYEL